MLHDLIDDLCAAAAEGDTLPPPFTGHHWDGTAPMPSDLKAKLATVLDGFYHAGMVRKNGRFVEDEIRDLTTRFESAEKRFLIEFTGDLDAA
ncbi:hypothetical protein [Paracoccus sp. (in: a-proteobacteria)]|uniref:hypothetical protein n=1 Tax=Paracoccus sp. TaxID=267 RepID=UPI00405996BC